MFPAQDQPNPSKYTGRRDYSELFDESPISIIIYTPEGSPIYSNPANLELWKFSPESGSRLRSTYNILNDPQLAAKGLMPDIKAALSGEVVEIPPAQYDLALANEGSEVKSDLDDLWIRTFAYPLRNKDKSVSAIVLMQVDVTQQMQDAAKLNQSELRFRELAENIREVFWLFDWAEQRVIYVSPAYEIIWDRSRADLYTRYEEWGESIHPDDAAYADESFQRIIETGGGEEREYRIVRPDGEVRWISDRGFAIKDDSGEIVQIAGIADDITDRRASVLELKGRLNFEEAIAEISAEFVGTRDLDESIQSCLRIIGSTRDASRAYLFLFKDQGRSMDNTHEWCAEGVSPQIESL